MRPNKLRELLKSNKPTLSTHIHTTWPSVVEAVAGAPGAAGVRVWHLMSRGRRRGATAASLPRVDSLIPPVTRITGHLKSLSVSILCQHHEFLNGTMGQSDLDVDASKLLKRLQTWPMVTVGAWPE